MTAAARIAAALERLADERAALCVDAGGLARMLNVSARTVRRLDDQGAIPRAIELGDCKRWHVEEIRAWLRCGAPDRRSWTNLRSAVAADRRSEAVVGARRT